MLAQAIGRDLAAIRDVLARLLQKGRVRQVGDGQYDVVLGRVTRRTTLPPQLWPALLAADRVYSEQEIATLRTVIPMLQFARARLSEFTDHGPGHALRVKSFATQLSYIQGLSSTERHLLRAGALFHDIGNIVSRERHNVVSQETVEKLAADGKLPFTRKEAKIIGLLCRWHRREYEPHRVDEMYGRPIQTGLMASMLRVADAMDIDHRRSDYNDRFRDIIRFFFPDAMPHWTSLDQVLGVRICCKPDLNLQVFTRGHTQDNLQISMLREDLESTPLNWSLHQLPVESAANTHLSPSPKAEDEAPPGTALLVFPFEAHSLVMAAISRRHLATAGYAIELLCYPDTSDGTRWLWQEALPEINSGDFDRVAIIGDRPEEAISSQLLRTVQQWQSNEAGVTVVNRHETNWSRLPRLLEMGVEVILGGDWAYFWGDAASETDLTWGRIAALCTRDPTQSTVGVTAQERAVTQGLLKVAYEAVTGLTVGDTGRWRALAEPIMNRIADNDRAYFADRARGFTENHASPAVPGRLEGRVVVFDQAPGSIPQSAYWIMEAAIEEHGRAPERGIRFNVPYTVATWPDGDAVELLAISHWREEEVIPIRLLYPSDIGPTPQGNESTIRVRMSPEQAPTVARALVAACNQ
jgi:hypothetical protein